MRFACDTGGTFTDLIVEDGTGDLHMFKASTTPDDPIRGVLDAVAVAAENFGRSVEELLGAGTLFIHGTTRAINAIITGNTAKTALLTTRGNPDVLLFREGGRIEPFNFDVPYPDPYIPRALTFEITERVAPDGSVETPLDEEEVRAIAAVLREEGVEAVAISYLWSISNPGHEQRTLEILAEELPDVPCTMAHAINPIIREYRRTSSSAIDASLKPLMGAYMTNLEGRLRGAGFGGRVLVVTSQGGVMDAAEIARNPIHCINSGPAMAPVAGRHYALVDANSDTAVVADTGGTTYDVSLIRQGAIPWTTETWIGQPFRGHMTGFPSVDVKSVGAGGGSIAWVDKGGMLRVGPQSAGADPGPVCYRRGGAEPTVTDAALTLGYLDGENFLGGAMALDTAASRQAIEDRVARPLGLSLHEAAAAIINVATQNMVHAIEDITIKQGIDPSKAVLIGGGGAAGLNSVLIGKRLNCDTLIIPETGAALSAAGALMSDLSARHAVVCHMNTGAFDMVEGQRLLDDLTQRCHAFARASGAEEGGYKIGYSFEGHYPSQVWDIEATIPGGTLTSPADVAAMKDAFHTAHEELFAFADRASEVEIVGWRAQVSVPLRSEMKGRVLRRADARTPAPTRRCYFPEIGEADVPVRVFETMAEGDTLTGPGIVESSLTTVVVNPGATARKAPSGSLIVALNAAG